MHRNAHSSLAARNSCHLCCWEEWSVAGGPNQIIVSSDLQAWRRINADSPVLNCTIVDSWSCKFSPPNIVARLMTERKWEMYYLSHEICDSRDWA